MSHLGAESTFTVGCLEGLPTSGQQSHQTGLKNAKVTKRNTEVTTVVSSFTNDAACADLQPHYNMVAAEVGSRLGEQRALVKPRAVDYSNTKSL